MGLRIRFLLKGLPMRLVSSSAIAVTLAAVAMFIPPVIGAQGQETARAVAGGGILGPGLDREDRRQRGEDRAGAEQREARRGRRKRCT